MGEGSIEVVRVVGAILLIVGGVKLYQKETSKDGGFWRKLVGIILFLFGVGTFYGVLTRVMGNVTFLDAKVVIDTIWGALGNLWEGLVGLGSRSA